MFVPTRSSRLKQETGESCQTIVYKSNKKEKPVTTPIKDFLPEVNEKINRKDNKNLDIKKLRYEVIKFGTSGFEGSQKEESKIALAVSLGAKPPKRKAKNYKEILAEKKLKNQQGSMSKSLINSKAKKNRFRGKPKNKNESRGMLNEYGRVRRDKQK